MKNSSDIYREAVLNGPLGYACHRIICDDSGKPSDYEYIEVNTAFEEQTGMKKADIEGKRVTEIFPHIISDPFDWIGWYGETALTGKRREKDQYSAILGRWFRITAYSTEKYYFITLFTDITERIEYERELKETNSRLDFLISENPSVIYRFRSGESGPEILYVSRNVTDVLGYSPDEIISRRPESWLEDVHPEDRDRVRDATMLLHKYGHLKYEYRYRHADGTYRWLHDELRLSPDSGTGEETVIGSWMDITERKRLEEALQDLNRFNQVILDQSPFGIVLYTQEGKAVMANNASALILGASSSDELMKQNFRSIDAWSDHGLIELADSALERGANRRKNIRVNTSFGRSVWVDITFIPMEVEKRPHLMVIFRDETDRIEAHRALRESELRFRQLAENIDQVFWLRTSEKMLYISPGYERVWGRTCDSLYERPDSFTESIHPEDREAVLREFRERADSFDMEYRILKPGGEVRWVWARSFDVPGGAEAEGRRAGIAEDITRRKEMENQLRENAIRDPLTGIHNRRYVLENLEGMAGKYDREGTPFAVAILDLDHFKNINDTFGHTAGDHVLKEFARIISENIRPYDLSGRYGGEEFIIAFRGTTRLKAISTMERILGLVRECELTFGGHNIRFTFSCGIADIAEDLPGSSGIESVISAADERLYRAKSAGRNMIVV